MAKFIGGIAIGAAGTVLVLAYLPVALVHLINVALLLLGMPI